MDASASYAAARLLITEHGAEAALGIAIHEIQGMLKSGDAQGEHIWMSVLKAMMELLAIDGPEPGEAGH